MILKFLTWQPLPQPFGRHSTWTGEFLHVSMPSQSPTPKAHFSLRASPKLISIQNGNAQEILLLWQAQYLSSKWVGSESPYGEEFAKHILTVYCIKRFKLRLRFIFPFTGGWLLLHRHSSNGILPGLFPAVTGSESLQSAVSFLE